MTAHRFLDLVGGMLLCIAAWSVAGVVVAISQGNAAAAWKFVVALLGSGATLIAASLFERRAQ